MARYVKPGDRVEPRWLGDAVQQRGGFHPAPSLTLSGNLGQGASLDANPGSSVGASPDGAPFAHQGLLVKADIETILYAVEQIFDGLLPKVPLHPNLIRTRRRGNRHAHLLTV